MHITYIAKTLPFSIRGLSGHTQLLLQEIECHAAATCHQNNCRHTHNYVLSAPVPLKLTCTYKLNYLLLKRTDWNYPDTYNHKLKFILVVGRTDPKIRKQKAPKCTQNFATVSPHFFSSHCDRPRKVQSSEIRSTVRITHEMVCFRWNVSEMTGLN